MKRILIFLSLWFAAIFVQAQEYKPTFKPADQISVAKTTTVQSAPVFKPTDVKNYIPVRAPKYMPLLVDELERLLPDSEIPWYFGALIEHESCLSLTHSRCWEQTSELLTKREQGTGFGQLTRTWNPDGTIRFDSLADIRREYITELRELSWTNIKDRPELQVLSNHQDHCSHLKFFADAPLVIDQYRFADSAYNGGRGDVRRARTKCSLTKGCDPDVWDDNVALHSPKSTKPLYGNRSAKDINLHHVHDVTHVRLGKYKRFFDKPAN